MKKINYLIILVAVIITASCSQYSRKPGKVYMPDMAYSRAYEFYSENPNFANNMTAQGPVAGTVPRGAMLPDHLVENDTIAAKSYKYDGTLTTAEIEEGGRIYNIHCGVCHGTALDGNGPLYKGGEGKYPAAPANFKDAKYLNMPVGTMYHALLYGKNLMGAYASQLDQKQRWAVLAYIKSEQAKSGGAPLATYFTVVDAPATNSEDKKENKESEDKGQASSESKEDTTAKSVAKADGKKDEKLNNSKH
jgi:mono/diheme cytochrome c family protein